MMGKIIMSKNARFILYLSNKRPSAGVRITNIIHIHGKQFILQKCQCKPIRKYRESYNNMVLCFAAIFYTDTRKITVCPRDSVLRRHRGSIHECKSWWCLRRCGREAPESCGCRSLIRAGE